MKISIITVSFNAAKTIEQTISSVVNQTYKDIEFIIIDGGSTDGTVDIIKRYDDRIAFWCSESDNGIYDAMNKGIEKSTGDYIQIIGSDDCLYSHDTIQKVVDSLDAETDIFSAARYEVDEEKKIQILATNKTAQYYKRGVLPWMPHTGIFVKGSYMKENLFDTSYKVAADYKFILKAYMDKNVKFQYVDYPVAFFSLSGVSNNFSSELQAENHRLCLELQLAKNIGVDGFVYNKKSLKSIVKDILSKMNLLTAIQCTLGKWEKHQCNNEICRWCGR